MSWCAHIRVTCACKCLGILECEKACSVGAAVSLVLLGKLRLQVCVPCLMRSILKLLELAICHMHQGWRFHVNRGSLPTSCLLWLMIALTRLLLLTAVHRADNHGQVRPRVHVWLSHSEAAAQPPQLLQGPHGRENRAGAHTHLLQLAARDPPEGAKRRQFLTVIAQLHARFPHFTKHA